MIADHLLPKIQLELYFFFHNLCIFVITYGTVVNKSFLKPLLIKVQEFGLIFELGLEACHFILGNECSLESNTEWHCHGFTYLGVRVSSVITYCNIY